MITRTTILALIVAATAVAQDETVQSGTPAVLEAVNGKKIQVYLQKLEDGNLTFQSRNSPKDMTVPVSKIKSLGFSMNKEEFDSFREKKIVDDETISEIYNTPDVDRAQKLGMIFKATLEAIEESYNQGDHAAVVSALEPVMSERGQYMPIENNLQDAFCMMMEACLSQGDYSRARDCAGLLVESDDPLLVVRGQVNLALAALAEDDLQTAEALHEKIGSEAAKLYLQACIQRAKGEPKAAMKTVVDIIAEHANDVEWLAPGELLSARLYLDLALTNSAANTARQVGSIYAGTFIGSDAAKLQAQLQPEEE